MARSPINLSYYERHTAQEIPTNNTAIAQRDNIVDTHRTAQRNFLFSDVNLQMNKTSQTEVRDRESVVQSIMMILGVSKRTRWFRPEFGVDLERLLFQPLDTVTANAIRSTIITGLTGSRIGDDRVNVRNVEVLPDVDNGNYFVSIAIEIPRLGLTFENIEFGLKRL